MRYGVALSHPDLGNDPGFLKDFAQSVEGAGFDHVLSAEHVVGGHPDRAARREGAHRRRALPRAVRAVRLPRRRHRAPGAGHQHPDPAAAPDGARGQAGGRAGPAHGRAAAPRCRASAATGWSTRRSTRTSRTAGARIEEQVEVLRRLWTDELVTFDGTWHHLDRIGLNPMPVQRPIPIWMGSFVGQVVEKVIRRIGRLADGWFPQMSPARAGAGGWSGCGATPPRRAATRPPSGSSAASPSRPATIPSGGSSGPTAYRALGATHLRVMTAGARLHHAAGAPRRRPALDRAALGPDAARLTRYRP